MIRWPAQLTAHLNDGKSLVRIFSIGGPSEISLETDRIPSDLRTLGARFVIVIEDAAPRPDATAEERDEAERQRIRVEQLAPDTMF